MTRIEQVSRFTAALERAPFLQGRVHASGKRQLIAHAERWRDGKYPQDTLRAAVEPRVRWAIHAYRGAREAVAAAIEESEAE